MDREETDFGIARIDRLRRALLVLCVRSRLDERRDIVLVRRRGALADRAEITGGTTRRFRGRAAAFGRRTLKNFHFSSFSPKTERIC